MRKLLLILSLLLSVGLFAQKSMQEVIDNPPAGASLKLVVDYTGTLTQLQVDALDRKLYQYDDTTSNQIAVIIVNTTEGYSIDDAAIELGRKWGVGSKDFNNGVVILVAIKDRKVTIQTGYGMEGVVPDVTAKSIIDNSITPNFKEGNYYRGLDQATDDIIKAAEGRYKAPANYAKKKKDGLGFGAILGILFLIMLFGIMGGGGRSGGGTMSGAGWIIGSILSNASRGGGGWSGGGGGGGGGGFGGFGGGGFGGGGASGSW